MRELFCAQSVTKIPNWKTLRCLNIGFILTFLKKLMLGIWQRLLQNWALYNQFSEGTFLCPIPIENCTPLKKILSCLNIGFILTCLKKLMLRICQRLLQNWAFYNQFSEGTFLCPIPIENRTPLKKSLSCLNISFILTFLKKFMLRIWQDCFRTEHFTTNLVREVFCAQSRSKIVRPSKKFWAASI